MRQTLPFLAAALCLGLTGVGPAQAISRYNSTGMTCGAVQSTIDRQGAVIFRYPGRTGVTLYNRYVADDRFCAGGEYAKSGTIPTKDTSSCPVSYCQMRPSPDDCTNFVDEGCFGWR